MLLTWFKGETLFFFLFCEKNSLFKQIANPKIEIAGNAEVIALSILKKMHFKYEIKWSRVYNYSEGKEKFISNAFI